MAQSIPEILGIPVENSAPRQQPTMTTDPDPSPSTTEKIAQEPTSVVIKVFSIPELLERILLDIDTIQLFVIQRTSKAIKDTIKTSDKLQQHMFLKHDPVSTAINPLLFTAGFTPAVSIDNGNAEDQIYLGEYEVRHGKLVLTFGTINEETIRGQWDSSPKPPTSRPVSLDFSEGPIPSWCRMLISHRPEPLGAELFMVSGMQEFYNTDLTRNNMFMLMLWVDKTYRAHPERAAENKKRHDAWRVEYARQALREKVQSVRNPFGGGFIDPSDPMEVIDTMADDTEEQGSQDLMEKLASEIHEMKLHGPLVHVSDEEIAAAVREGDRRLCDEQQSVLGALQRNQAKRARVGQEPFAIRPGKIPTVALVALDTVVDEEGGDASQEDADQKPSHWADEDEAKVVFELEDENAWEEIRPKQKRH